jgi:hypothetical protein
VIVVLFIVLCAVLFALVGLRRRGARNWERTQNVLHEGDDQAARYGRVWFQRVPPRSSMRAYKDRRTCTLSTDPVHRVAAFEFKTGEREVLDHLLDVNMGGRGSDFVNTWIEIHYGDTSDPKVAYVNDGGWFGWRPLLTGSNVRIARSLTGLMREPE